MAELKKNIDAFSNRNTRLFALSVDDPDQLRQLKESMSLPFELLSDPNREAIKAWGLFNPYEAGGIAVPAVFVFGADSKVKFRAIEKTHQRVTVDQLIAFLDNVDKDPSFSLESQDLASVAVGGASMWRITKNLFSMGDKDDWKHILLFPWEMLQMAMGTKSKKK